MGYIVDRTTELLLKVVQDIGAIDVLAELRLAVASDQSYAGVILEKRALGLMSLLPLLQV